MFRLDMYIVCFIDYGSVSGSAITSSFEYTCQPRLMYGRFRGDI